MNIYADRIVNVDWEQVVKTLRRYEELKKFDRVEHYIEHLDDYVGMHAWSGEAANKFRRELTDIENRVADDRKKFDELVERLAEYSKVMTKSDDEGL